MLQLKSTLPKPSPKIHKSEKCCLCWLAKQLIIHLMVMWCIMVRLENLTFNNNTKYDFWLYQVRICKYHTRKMYHCPLREGEIVQKMPSFVGVLYTLKKQENVLATSSGKTENVTNALPWSFFCYNKMLWTLNTILLMFPKCLWTNFSTYWANWVT